MDNDKIPHASGGVSGEACKLGTRAGGETQRNPPKRRALHLMIKTHSHV